MKSRLESSEGLSLMEFTYQALQGHDWAHLHATRRCLVQLGGNDQLGNMVAGQEVLQGEPCWGVLLPLITDEAGNKFGKSAGGGSHSLLLISWPPGAGAPVWLDQSKTSVFDFYQFFVRVPDAVVGSLLRQFTFLPEQEVEALEEKLRQSPEDRAAQTALAQQVGHYQEEFFWVQRSTVTTFSFSPMDLRNYTNCKSERFEGDTPCAWRGRSSDSRAHHSGALQAGPENSFQTEC